MEEFERTERSTLVRKRERASYDRETVYAILDEALVCHVGIVVDGGPVVLPTAHWRDGAHLYIHGSRVAGLLQAVRDGAEMCIAVTLLDGLVLARSGFHHSMNYRSAVVFGRAEAVQGRADKCAAMRAFMERIAPGRWDELRPPTDKELDATLVLALALEEASAKVRTGPPSDDAADYALPVWAGVLPVMQTLGTPVPDPRLAPGIKEPAYLRRRGWSNGADF